MSRKDRVEEKLRERDFRDQDVRDLLNELPVSALVAEFGKPSTYLRYQEPVGYWNVGDGHPSLADEDPAVQQAIGRCAAYRARELVRFSLGGIHPSECDWCGYPVEELLKVCDWATVMARFVSSEELVWKGKDGSTYLRFGPGRVYQNPRHAKFWALPSEERARLIAGVQYPSREAA